MHYSFNKETSTTTTYRFNFLCVIFGDREYPQTTLNYLVYMLSG